MHERFARTAFMARIAVPILLLGTGSLFAAAPQLAGNQAFSGSPVDKEVMIALDGTRAPSDVAVDLALAGFPSMSEIERSPARFGYRIVYVSSVNATTLDAIRAVPGIAAVRRVYELGDTGKPLYHTGEVVVRLLSDAPQGTLDSLMAKYNAALVRQFTWLPDAYLLRVPDTDTSDAMTVAAAMHAEPTVQWSHANVLTAGLVEPTGVDVQDTLFPYQWHLNNTGQLPGAVPGADVNALRAWETTEGQGAIVAVIDDSVQKDHEDLRDNFLMGWDFMDDDDDPSPGFPGEGHGVCTSGLIVARANNIGTRGVAPMASLIGIRWGGTTDSFAEGFPWAEAHGAQVISNSWHIPTGWVPGGAPVADNIIASAVRTVATGGRGGRGCLVLFSSGNNAIWVSYDNALAALPYTMAIGATQRDDTLTCYSSYGEEQSVVAPGGGGWPAVNPPTTVCYDSDIATTDVQESFYQVSPLDGLPAILGYNPPVTYRLGYYRVLDTTIEDFPQTAYTRHFAGTSAACPVAAGVATLAFSVDPNMTAKDARNLMEHTAAKVGEPNLHYDTVTGHNIYMGHGRVDAYATVQAARNHKRWPSPVTGVQNVSSQALARIIWTDPDWDGDGTADDDVSGVLVVRGALGTLEWAPTDGQSYLVGQMVAPGVIVVANSLTTSLDEPALSKGDYEYAIFVRNAANYYSWGRRTSFTSSGAVNVPLASIQVSATTGAAPLAVHFAGGAVDASSISSLIWSFGDGGSGQGLAADHTYTAAGKYTATLTVTNSVGQTAQTTVVIDVLPGTNALPVVTISATPETGNAPLSVLFRGNATDADGAVVRYDWDFGDGFTATGQLVEHIYLNPGTYGVTLTATDNAGGQGMASSLIAVTSGTTTAADIVDTTSPAAKPGFCGGGVALAAAVSAIGLCGLLGLRRRR